MDKTSNMGQNMVKSTGDVEIDLSLMAKAVWKRIWLVVLVSVIAAGAMLVGVKIFVKPTYRFGFTAYVNNKKEVDSNSLTAQDIQASRSLVHTYEEVIRSESVLESSAKSVGLNYSYSQLKKMVTTSIGDKTEIITVNVDTKNPETSYELADAVSRNSIEYTTKIIEGSSMKIVGYPEVPTDIYSPNYLRFAAMGAFLGFFFGADHLHQTVI